MGEEKRTERSLVPLVGMIALGIVCAFIFGFVVSNMVSEGAVAVPDEGGGQSVTAQVTLKDGTTLGARLAALEKSLTESQSMIKQDLFKGLKEAINNRRIFDLETVPVHFLEFNADYLGSKGPEDAIVTIVEFSCYQCPFCSKMAVNLEEFWKKYPDQVRIIFVDRPLISKHRDGFPFHPYAFVAHEASLEAQAQGKFWEMHHYLFEHQKELFPKRPKTQEEYKEKLDQLRKDLVEAADKLGLNKNKMKKALENHTHKKKLDEMIELANKMKITGTPTVLVNAFFKMRSTDAMEVLLEKSYKIE